MVGIAAAVALVSHSALFSVNERDLTRVKVAASPPVLDVVYPAAQREKRMKIEQEAFG